MCVCVCVCVCVCACVGEGGTRGYNHSNIYHNPANVCRPPAVLAGGAVVTKAFYTHNACWYMRALNNNGNEHKNVTKIEKNTLKK